MYNFPKTTLINRLKVKYKKSGNMDAPIVLMNAEDNLQNLMQIKLKSMVSKRSYRFSINLFHKFNFKEMIN